MTLPGVRYRITVGASQKTKNCSHAAWSGLYHGGGESGEHPASGIQVATTWSDPECWILDAGCWLLVHHRGVFNLRRSASRMPFHREPAPGPAATFRLFLTR